MATQAQRQLASPSVTRLKQWSAFFLEPRSQNRDEAFRERTIRITLTIIMSMTILAWISTFVVFQNEWQLISYPSLFTFMLIIGGLTTVAIARQQIALAGNLLVLLLLVTTVINTLIPEAVREVVAIPIFMLTITVGALVLPRFLIVPLGILCAVLQGVLVQFAYPVDVRRQDLIWGGTSLFLVQALFLRQIRVEFDSRLSAMRDLIQQTEIARREADQASNAKSQFLANMSHELRTPLNAIIGYIDIMLNGMAGAFTEQQTQLQRYVHDNAHRLLALINDILDLAKIESGRMEIIAVPSSPRKVVGDIVNSMQSLAQKKNISLTINLSEEVPEAVICDVKRTQQIVTNLVSNAIKFTMDGGVEVYVGTTGKDNWQIKVTDTGIGMPEDAPSYIFEKFRQVDSTASREHYGTGLGLAIVKSLVDGLDGTIEVQTKMGKGTTFTVTLPRVYSAAPATNQVLVA